MKPRRLVVFGLGLVTVVGALALTLNQGALNNAAALSEARSYQTLEWAELMPPRSVEAERAVAELNLGIDRMTAEEINAAKATIENDGEIIVADIDGRDVSMEGFLVPIDFDAERTSEFLLVSYFGACIHVPPPPPNQIVLVKIEDGLAISEFESQVSTRFRISGRISAAHATTDIADVGYQLMASGIEKVGDF